MLKNLKVHFGKVSIIMIAVFAALLATDLILKSCEEAYAWNFTVIPNFIWVESGRRNSGAAFSFLANAEWGQTFLIIITCILLIAVVAAFIFMPEKFVLLKLAASFMVAGGIGNLVDRLAMREVRDFVWVNMLGNWACCNFADFWIVFAAVIVVVDMLFINEYSLLPLTKKAKAAQALRREKEEKGEEPVKEEPVSENTDGEEKDES